MKAEGERVAFTNIPDTLVYRASLHLEKATIQTFLAIYNSVLNACYESNEACIATHLKLKNVATS